VRNHRFLDVIIAAVLAGAFSLCVYCVKQICPEDSMFTPLELDQIRIERVEDRERSIMGKIDRMKVDFSR
jgi:hypothetical protein